MSLYMFFELGCSMLRVPCLSCDDTAEVD